jgi:hypothetical protein
MIINTNETITCYDVDETLVLWFNDCDISKKINIVCPYSGAATWLKPHHRHIDLLKKHHGRKNYIIVWSAGGVLWAEAVVKALGLEEYVDLVMTKPTKFVDDLPANEILGTHIYLTDKDEK